MHKLVFGDGGYSGNFRDGGYFNSRPMCYWANGDGGCLTAICLWGRCLFIMGTMDIMYLYSE